MTKSNYENWTISIHCTIFMFMEETYIITFITKESTETYLLELNPYSSQLKAL